MTCQVRVEGERQKEFLQLIKLLTQNVILLSYTALSSYIILTDINYIDSNIPSHEGEKRFKTNHPLYWEFKQDYDPTPPIPYEYIWHSLAQPFLSVQVLIHCLKFFTKRKKKGKEKAGKIKRRKMISNRISILLYVVSLIAGKNKRFWSCFECL